MIARLSLDTSDFDSKKPKVESGLKDIANQFGLLGKIAAGAAIGEILADITKEVIGFAKETVKLGIDYELTMTRIKSITASTSQQMDSLRDAAISTNRAIVASDVMLVLGTRGHTAAQQLAELPAVMDFMLLHNKSAEESVNGLIHVMDAYHMKASDMAYVTDIMTTSVRLSREPIDDIQNQFASLSAIAAALNYPLEQVAVDLILLGEGGYKGEKAATNLGTAMRRAVVVGQGYQLGTSDINKQLLILKDRGYNAGEIVQIYGGKMGVAAGVLSVMIDKQDEFTKKFEEAKNVTHEGAQVIQDEGSRAFERLGESAKTAAVGIWSDFRPLFQVTATGFRKWLDDVNFIHSEISDLLSFTAKHPELTWDKAVDLFYSTGGKKSNTGVEYGPKVPPEIAFINAVAEAEADSKIIKPTEVASAKKQAWSDILKNDRISLGTLRDLWKEHYGKAKQEIEEYGREYARATQRPLEAQALVNAQIIELDDQKWKSMHDAANRGVDDTVKAYQLETQAAHMTTSQMTVAWSKYEAERRIQIRKEAEETEHSTNGKVTAFEVEKAKTDELTEQRIQFFRKRTDEELNARINADEAILSSAQTTSEASKAAWADYFAASKVLIDEQAADMALLHLSAKQQSDYAQAQLRDLVKNGYEKTGQYLKLWSMNLPTTMQQNFSSLFFDVLSAKIKTWRQLWLDFAGFLKNVMDSVAKAIADDFGRGLVNSMEKGGIFKFFMGLVNAIIPAFGGSDASKVAENAHYGLGPLSTPIPIISTPIQAVVPLSSTQGSSKLPESFGGGPVNVSPLYKHDMEVPVNVSPISRSNSNENNGNGITIIQHIYVSDAKSFQTNSQQLIQRAMSSAQVHQRRAGLAA